MKRGIYIKYIMIAFSMLLTITNLCACAGSSKAEPFPDRVNITDFQITERKKNKGCPSECH